MGPLGATAKITAIARWIGICGAAANHFRMVDGTTGMASYVRDAQADPKAKAKPRGGPNNVKRFLRHQCPVALRSASGGRPCASGSWNASAPLNGRSGSERTTCVFN